MIEFVLLDYLETALNIPAYMEKPADMSGYFLVLEKLGSYEDNFIPHANIAVQAYAPTLAEAAKLNSRVKSAMSDAITIPAVSSVKLNSDYNFTDTETKQYRYQSVYVITYAQEVDNG